MYLRGSDLVQRLREIADCYSTPTVEQAAEADLLEAVVYFHVRRVLLEIADAITSSVASTPAAGTVATVKPARRTAPAPPPPTSDFF